MWGKIQETGLSAAAYAESLPREDNRLKAPPAERTVHPDCINASDPYHECEDECFRKIIEARERGKEGKTGVKIDADGAVLNQSRTRCAAVEGLEVELEKPKEGLSEWLDSFNTVGIHCAVISSLNQRNMLETLQRMGLDNYFQAIVTEEDGRGGATYWPGGGKGMQREDGGPTSVLMEQNEDDIHPDKFSHQTGITDGNDSQHVQNDTEASYPILNERQKKMLELTLKMSEARKANQTAMVAEKKKMEAPTESRGVSKQTWIEDRKKKIGKLLDSNGLDMSKAFMLDTQDQAEAKYKKWEKEPAPSGWDVFNQKTLYDAYKKRTKNIVCDMEAYNKAKEADPEFYRDAASLQYGKVTKTPDENIDRMVKELEETKNKREAFSRRRKFHEEKDVDSINDRNEHFNKKIERAFGKYTLEIKNNLERGTALPD